MKKNIDITCIYGGSLESSKKFRMTMQIVREFIAGVFYDYSVTILHINPDVSMNASQRQVAKMSNESMQKDLAALDAIQLPLSDEDECCYCRY